MKLVCISDTHGKHRKLQELPHGDTIIFAGDFSNVGERYQVEDFFEWLKSQPHKYKVVIAGNHDKSFDPKYTPQTVPHIISKPEWLNDLLKTLPKYRIHYLENSGVEIEGIKFWGSPITPDFGAHFWAFNSPRGSSIKKYWDMIPIDTDVLITHGPPVYRLDAVSGVQHVGCADLESTVFKVKPKIHVFGHIHEAYGKDESDKTRFVNASSADEYYRICNAPIEIEIENKIK